jgi:hypothetical protein
MAGSLMQAETRVVLARSRRKRADSRASTEPHGPPSRVRTARGSQSPMPVPAPGDGSEWVVETVPYARHSMGGGEPDAVQSAALAAEIAIEDLSRRHELEADGETPRPSAEYLEMELYRPVASLQTHDGFEVIETMPFERALDQAPESVDEPPTHKEEALHRRGLQSAARLRTESMPFLGVVASAPEVGACLVIGCYDSPEFRITSPVTRVFARAEGVLVQTLSKSRYFVEHGGGAYLVRKLD